MYIKKIIIMIKINNVLKCVIDFDHRQAARIYVRGLLRHQHTATSENLGSASKYVRPFDDIPGPSGIYSVPYLGTALHFKPFSKSDIS